MILGSGYVPAWAAVIFGVCGGIFCNLATQLKHWIGVDDALDIFAVHAIGGLIGDLLTGIFAADYIAHLDGYTEIHGGWINGNWIQPAIQLCAGMTGMGWSFTVSYLILSCMSILGRLVPSLRLRVSKDEEELGIDHVEIGEYAYDYVELTREINPVVVENPPCYGHLDQSLCRIDVSRPVSGRSSYAVQMIRPISAPELRPGFF